VPLDVEARGAPQFLSVERITGRPVSYIIQTTAGVVVRINADPERAGPTRLAVAFVNEFGDERLVHGVVVTTQVASHPARQHRVHRLGAGHFVADVVLSAPRTKVAVVATNSAGTRFRATTVLELSGR
jgi:hypothetical protein